MKEIEPIKQEPIHQEIVAPVKTESKRLVSRVLPKGMTQWEFNLKTHEGKPVDIKSTEVVNTQLGVQLRHRIEYRKDRYYCAAINLKNAAKKYRKWRIANEHARIIMARKQAFSPSPNAE
jgi:hypothetical protein